MSEHPTHFESLTMMRGPAAPTIEGEISHCPSSNGSVPWLRLIYHKELRAGHFNIKTPYVDWLEERLGSILHEQEMLFLHTRCPKNHNFVKKQWEAGEHIHLLQNT